MGVEPILQNTIELEQQNKKQQAINYLKAKQEYEKKLEQQLGVDIDPSKIIVKEKGNQLVATIDQDYLNSLLLDKNQKEAELKAKELEQQIEKQLGFDIPSDIIKKKVTSQSYKVYVDKDLLDKFLLEKNQQEANQKAKELEQEIEKQLNLDVPSDVIKKEVTAKGYKVYVDKDKLNNFLIEKQKEELLKKLKEKVKLEYGLDITKNDVIFNIENNKISISLKDNIENKIKKIEEQRLEEKLFQKFVELKFGGEEPSKGFAEEKLKQWYGLEKKDIVINGKINPKFTEILEDIQRSKFLGKIIKTLKSKGLPYPFQEKGSVSFEDYVKAGYIVIKDGKYIFNVDKYKDFLINRTKKELEKEYESYLGIDIDPKKAFIVDTNKGKIEINKEYFKELEKKFSTKNEVNNFLKEAEKIKEKLTKDIPDIIITNTGWTIEYRRDKTGVTGFTLEAGEDSPWDVYNYWYNYIKGTGDLSKLFELKQAYRYAKNLKTESRRRRKDKKSKYKEYEVWWDWKGRDPWDDVDKWDEIREKEEIGDISKKWAEKITNAQSLEELDKLVKQARNELVDNAINRARCWGILDYSWKDNVKKLQELDKLIPDNVDKIIKLKSLIGEDTNLDLNRINQLKKDLVQDFLNDAKSAYASANKEKARQLEKKAHDILNRLSNVNDKSEFYSLLGKLEKINKKISKYGGTPYDSIDIQLIAGQKAIKKIEEFNKTDDLNKKEQIIKELKRLPQSSLVVKKEQLNKIENQIKEAKEWPNKAKELYDKIASDNLKKKFKVEVKGNQLVITKLRTNENFINKEIDKNFNEKNKEPFNTKELVNEIINQSKNNLLTHSTSTELTDKAILYNLMNDKIKQPMISPYNPSLKEKIDFFVEDKTKKLASKLPKPLDNIFKGAVGTTYGFTSTLVGGTVGLALDVKDTITFNAFMPRTTGFIKEVTKDFTTKEGGYFTNLGKSLASKDAFESGKALGELATFTTFHPKAAHTTISKPISKIGKIIEAPKYFGKEFISAEQIVEKPVLEGKERFPVDRTYNAEKVIQEFKSEKYKIEKLDNEFQAAGWHATITKFDKETKTAKGSSENVGLYIAPSLSKYFLRLDNTNEYKFSLLPNIKINKPSALFIKIKDVERLPEEVRYSIEKSNDFLTTKADKDKAYITARFELKHTPEKEAVIPPDSTIVREIKETNNKIKDIWNKVTGFDAYTEINGKKIPVLRYKVKNRLEIIDKEKIIKTQEIKEKGIEFYDYLSDEIKNSKKTWIGNSLVALNRNNYSKTNKENYALENISKTIESKVSNLSEIEANKISFNELSIRKPEKLEIPENHYNKNFEELEDLFNLDNEKFNFKPSEIFSFRQTNYHKGYFNDNFKLSDSFTSSFKNLFENNYLNTPKRLSLEPLTINTNYPYSNNFDIPTFNPFNQINGQSKKEEKKELPDNKKIKLKRKKKKRKLDFDIEMKPIALPEEVLRWSL